MMPEKDSPENHSEGVQLPKFARHFIRSKYGVRLANFPPIAWLLSQVTRMFVKRHMSQLKDSDRIEERPITEGLQGTLDAIVFDVVHALNYLGAMVATYEQGDVLPVRAFYVDPDVASVEQIYQWEQEVSKKDPDHPVSITNPKVARVSLYNEEDQENLSVKAVLAKQSVTSSELYDLFRPIAIEASKPIIQGIQKEVGMKEVVAVPFFLDGEVVGTLFAFKRDRITEDDKLILAAFGKQAAAAIEGERRQLLANLSQELVLQLQTSLAEDEKDILQAIAEGIVNDLGYVVAAVASYDEESDALPLYGFYIDPEIVSMEQIRVWEKQVSDLDPDNPVSITNPEIARIYVHNPYYKENLSARAAKQREIVPAKKLFELFTPIIGKEAEPIIDGIQDALGIKSFIAVPFFLGDEFVGNLFAASSSKALGKGNIELLQAFGRQAAAGIHNARLYRRIEEQREIAEKEKAKAEDQREIAQVIATMAFSASKSIHSFRNHIGFVRGQIQLFQYLKMMSEEDKKDIIGKIPRVIERLDIIADILDQLHEPWRPVDDRPTNVNGCLTVAKDTIIPAHTQDGIELEENLAKNLPLISVAPDMLTEAFRILIKNAVEAIRTKETRGGKLRLSTFLSKDKQILVEIADNGTGIQSEYLENVFELSWTTKSSGLGFGLFWTRDYIEGLGGTVEVESVWQEGTTFWVALVAAPEKINLEGEDIEDDVSQV
ncbi:MAG: hypothetical protein GY796_26920 [Chloroflexi bacterium]|nr:hypothetical protein [Chloroflexota bacterium]